MRQQSTRREFVKASATAALVAPHLLATRGATASATDSLRIGVVGTGGRGTGACRDALQGSANMKLVAMGDIFAEKCRNARRNLTGIEGISEMVDVPDENIYDGLDAYKKVVHHPDVDIVLLTTPPGFRPIHLAEVVRARKHAFVEKPVCVDAAGYRSCIESGVIARKNGTAIVAGTMYRRQKSYIEAVKRIHDGMIGELLSGIAYYNSTGIWYRPRTEGMSDAEYQLNNWYHFLWVCGDQIVEQAVHNLDAVNWVMGSRPISAYGSGGQMTRPEDSEIYDHMSLEYAYPNGASVSFKCRQIPNSTSRVINTFIGTKGIAYVNPGNSRIVSHDGTELFRQNRAGNNPYVQEHTDLVTSIRAGEPLVEIEQVADSSLTAVTGRCAAYSGHDVTCDWVADESQLDLFPKNLTIDSQITSPGVPVPGRWQLV